MTNRNIVNPLKNVDIGGDGTHSLKVMEHMRLNLPQAIMLALTELTSTMALTRQSDKKSYIQQQMITQSPEDRFWQLLGNPF